MNLQETNTQTPSQRTWKEWIEAQCGAVAFLVFPVAFGAALGAANLYLFDPEYGSKAADPSAKAPVQDGELPPLPKLEQLLDK